MTKFISPTHRILGVSDPRGATSASNKAQSFTHRYKQSNEQTDTHTDLNTHTHTHKTQSICISQTG